MALIDNFDGEWADVEKLTDERLDEIRSLTVDEMNGRGTRWQHQLDVIDEERARRESVADTPLFQCPHCGAPTDNPGEALMHCDPAPVPSAWGGRQ